MRAIICALLILVPSLCHAGPAAKRMLAVMDSATYETTTFESGTVSPWSGFIINGNSSFAHNGAWSAVAAIAGSGVATLSRTMDTTSGSFGFWLRSDGTPNTTVTAKAAGVTVASQTGVVGTTWVRIAGSITAAASQLLEIQITNLSGSLALYYVDDIAVPVL
jgi:hypothetical protein